ncbi:MAG: 2-phospho-L-lactate guanylyltransferase [Dehalococcoidia bacterium]|nr:2-phospho-L-lactate guanylyltransferase [Dehalococcoidia bacterium]
MTTALIPVNRLERAKGRLAERLDAATREALARATFTTVLDASRRVFSPVVVLTADEAAAAIATAAGARVIAEDPARSGLNPQLEHALAILGEPGGGIAILHADLPFATRELLEGFLSAAPDEPSVTLVRSVDGGTNLMLLRPAGRFALAYGPGSYEKHVAAATAAGMAITAFESPPLELDLDTPADLEACMAMPGALATRAGALLAARGFLPA